MNSLYYFIHGMLVMLLLMWAMFIVGDYINNQRYNHIRNDWVKEYRKRKAKKTIGGEKNA